MISDLSFRWYETQRFLAAIFTSRQGRGFLFAHVLNTLLLAVLVWIALSLALFGLLEGYVMRRRMMALSLATLFALLAILPLATMPFFSFKDVVNRCVRALTRRRLFVNLSRHVYFRPTLGGDISLHLAKAHTVLAEKRKLVAAGSALGQNTSRQLACSLARSIRDAVRRARRLVRKGMLEPNQQIVGATYGYLFGAAKSKLRLRRHVPSRFSRLLSGVFYRYGALHAVYMYFIIHDRLPAAFDPVYFVASVGEVVSGKGG
ncbi:hypothetical protein SAMN05660860_01799 [Geoalkalibacter ferrihydriticus]|uniref:Uncharacterized protein n=2 Tax=Geoalkalibacter ferrihydriticus TaxID=392333 RepID=A0A0C2DT94_9BACT|nr:hypothetical protein [Geoalkalibacter ferrihydriticus]KIH76654.1 hypothetical protein GFER_10905 [Geoalkalibacter ferrihydriticus DSM 17813]SDM05172.1 hypothetical protein SAMN05660860_01799 [Geoalkalibacter ferrihydriticus]